MSDEAKEEEVETKVGKKAKRKKVQEEKLGRGRASPEIGLSDQKKMSGGMGGLGMGARRARTWTSLNLFCIPSLVIELTGLSVSVWGRTLTSLTSVTNGAIMCTPGNVISS